MTDKPAFISVKVAPDVYRMARTIAAWRGQNISEYLSQLLRPVLRRDLAKMNKEIEGQPVEE